MWKKSKIDTLLLFFVLSISLLGISWYFQLIQLEEEKVQNYHESVSFKNKTRLTYENTQIKEVKALHPQHNIYYSTDGGASFVKAGGELKMGQIQMPDEIINIPTAVRWRAPLNNFAEVKAVRVMLVDEQKKIRSNIVDLVNTQTVEHDLPLIHLTLHQSDLLSEQKGVHVLGATSWNQSGFYEAWWDRKGNFSNRGMDWEKHINFQLFENGELKHNQNCGLRISGNATRGFSQKSFRLKARKIYGDGKFEYPLMGYEGLKKYESLVLRMSGNDNTKTLFADMLMQQLANGAEVLTQKGRPAVVYINGNYWGIYNMRERIDTYFIAKYEDAKSKHITILEDGAATLKDGKKKDKEAFDDLIKELKAMDQVEANDFAMIEEEIQINSFMDYLFFETYYANNDWPNNNSMCYRVKEGKWKWLLNDLDYSLAYPGATNLQINILDKLKTNASVHAIIFQKLLTHKPFKDAFKKRCIKNMEKYFNENRITTIYRDLKQNYESEIPAHISRWRMIDSYRSWEQNCEQNLDFLLNRREVYKKQIEEL
ncbi:MAG: CotH kinase family protein [Crocinitomicaceae bacterium]